ncbi:glycosyl hydrolase family 76 [Drepanopeziza brunnea f. sp. 'multigermtubi' MB_m1]|uniref:Mannan endo-1,6-alpha-mannosidase n=2 Tax=Drepanopeziza brunnea f. sp. 'multigermtubi' TaxID=698441 RepID=K1XJR4_MARBU|nr:glycosyl hydrolase family 76 [Drepanopeziza brunnea f. sp. 'multigermtubi' MB_m1]EKD20933.1 glycosyl hydrolase family 76 [Drepanopeziza brunnea f. sp. 'multigermtubi' MB_m1]
MSLPTLVSGAAMTALTLWGMIGCAGVVQGIEVDLSSTQSIKDGAATLAYDMMSFYKGNQSGGIIGVLPGPPPNPPDGYYWWESGAMWGAMIDYWHYTGDESYNDVVSTGIQAQVGENLDLMPRNWSQSMGNDDQGFWGLTAMSAAETNFTNPPSGSPGWLALAQAVFNSQSRRTDGECGGGLRWQVFPYLIGYDYKNSIANGCFFNIAARLARYTDNSTYYDHAVQTWDWITSVGFIDKDYNVFDGGHIGHNCTDINRVQFSYNIAIWLLGAANMYNYTNGSSIWEDRVNLLLNSTFNTFFPNDIAYEVACEPKLTCSIDMFSFKSYVMRWLAATSMVAPFTRDRIMPKLRKSAQAAAAQCTGGATGRTCGLSWSSGVYDGTVGVGQQMAAMSALFVNILPLQEVPPPLTNNTGGTSVGNPDAGARSVTDLRMLLPPSEQDKAGAAVITAVWVAASVVLFGWMSVGES